MSNLSFAEKDALNVCLRWFGGKFNWMDLSVASISTSVVRDLTDEGYLRKRFIGWEITKKGKQALEDANIKSFSDTRSY